MLKQDQMQFYIENMGQLMGLKRMYGLVGQINMLTLLDFIVTKWVMLRLLSVVQDENYFAVLYLNGSQIVYIVGLSPFMH